MTTPIERPMVSPALIGRGSELAALTRLAEQARNGQGQIAILAGEAGIGKSRLIGELRHSLESAGAWSRFQGRCFEPDQALPYAPWIDLLRSYFSSRSSAEIADHLGGLASKLAQLLPELAGSSGVATADPDMSAEQDKQGLYQALFAFFDRFPKPLWIVVEDIHWSDDASLDFLASFARRLVSLPIFLVLTYRSEEIRSGLKRFLAELDHDRLVVELSLTALTMDDVQGLIQAIFETSYPVPPAFVEPIYALTEGNPFFIEEILKSLLATGNLMYQDGQWNYRPLPNVRIPRSVQIAVQRRAEQVTSEARQILTLAAVAGRRFDFTLLQRLTPYDEAQLLNLIKELIGAQLVVEESEDIFTFRHALTQQAVYTDLLARERRALHRAIAETSEALYTDQLESHLADLAHHCFAAQLWEKALKYAAQAGRRAQRLHAPQAAAEHFSQALEAAQKLNLPPPLPMLAARGQVHELLGEFERARRDYEARLEAARALGDRLEVWQGMLDLGWLWTNRDYEQAGAYFEQALVLTREMDDAALQAQTLNRVGNWHTHAEHLAEALGSHREALDINVLLNDKKGQAATLDLLGITSFIAGDVPGGAAYYQQAVALFRELEDRVGLSASLAVYAMRGASYNLDVLVCPIVSLDESRRDSQEALQAARQVGWRSGEASALLYQGFGLGPRGMYKEALASALAGLDLATAIGHRQWMSATHLVSGALYRDLFALADARQHHESALELAQAMGSTFDVQLTTGYLASTYVALNELARAEVTLNAVLTNWSSLPSLAQRIAWCARAELALARREYRETLEITQRLIDSIPNVESGVVPRLWQLRAEALIGLDQPSSAERLLLAARDTARDQGTPLRLWRILVSLGRLYQLQGVRDRADEELAEADSILDTLTDQIGDTSLRETFVRHARSLMPRGAMRSPRQAARQAYDGLTEREREVARLIAQGKSNLAIADDLVLSRRTVEKHVDNILSKLGFTSRAQIAVWAVEKGLG